MKVRIITGVVAVALFIPICIFSEYIVFPIAMAILCAIGVFEIAKCLNFHKNLIITIPMYIVALCLPIIRYKHIIPTDSKFLIIAMACAFVVLIYVLAYATFKKNRENLSEIMMLYGMFVYVVGCFSAIVMVRYSSDGVGNFMYLLIFMGAWVSDTFAYFTGKFIGKHKLIPSVSPKKTVEGAIGGIVFTLIAFVVFGIIVRHYFSVQVPIYQFCILGIVLPIVSQIGDLIASCVKRQYGIKDFGKVFPGHGGVLDRFDSVMLVAPTLCIIDAIVNLVNGVYVL